jgi:hypothetical protein
MRALIVYETMYGSTRTVAEHIALGLADRFDATLVPVAEATSELVADADLLVCGGPTHAHGLSRPGTRRMAVDGARKDQSLEVVPGAAGPGLREWTESLERREGVIAAAFDTRIDGPSVLTGRAAKAIARRLHRRGYTLAVAPGSFLVDKTNHLLADQPARAKAWGAALAVAAAMSPAQPHP